jgi:TPP-dependent pyruvate/acetoin dehydrogenase alpha subunit
MALTPQELLEMYRKMVTIRRFDQRAVEEFHAGNIPGVIHAYIGQEAVAFFGDGASNEGAFHGSLNLASIWKLPVIYVCENNRWAIADEACVTCSAAAEIAALLTEDPPTFRALKAPPNGSVPPMCRSHIAR